METWAVRLSPFLPEVHSYWVESQRGWAQYCISGGIYSFNRHNLDASYEPLSGKAGAGSIKLNSISRINPTPHHFIGKVALDKFFELQPSFLSNPILGDLGNIRRRWEFIQEFQVKIVPQAKRWPMTCLAGLLRETSPLISSCTSLNKALQLKPGPQNTKPYPTKDWACEGHVCHMPGWLQSRGQTGQWRRWDDCQVLRQLSGEHLHPRTPFPIL